LIIHSYTTFRHHFATSATLANDGAEEWPEAELRSGGFDDGFTGIPTPITAFPITVSVDGSANGDLAYHVYLSQRTDDEDSQYLSITRTSGKSGTFTIALTNFGADALGLEGVAEPVTTDQLKQAMKYTYLYVSRLSDSAIQVADLLDATLEGVE
jgi:hypothetical protein